MTLPTGGPPIGRLSYEETLQVIVRFGCFLKQVTAEQGIAGIKVAF